MLNGKEIVPGITGSTVTYKTCHIIRGLIKQGAEVQVVITPAGKEFIVPITLFALTDKPVTSEFFAQRDRMWNSHVDLGLWADAILIASVAASIIGKMANGITDNILITTHLPARASVFIAPAMDLGMFAHPSTQESLDTLRSYGNHIIEPAPGELASHLVGKGHMEEPEDIIRVLGEFFSSTGELAGGKVLIIAGLTYEKIDSVRFTGSYSPGKMGFALAEECARRGTEVVLIAGSVQQKVYHSHITRIDVESAQEMYEAAVIQYTLVDAGVLCTAVADFTPDVVADKKIKQEGDGLMLHLKPAHDTAVVLDKLRTPGQRLVGFVLETNDEQRNAEGKLTRRNFDPIVLNSLDDAGTDFHYNTNKINTLSCRGRADYPLKSKTEAARGITGRMIKEL